MFTFEIDFSKCKTLDEMYKTIYKALEVPDWCGHNLDALYDVLRGFMAHPAVVTIKGIDSLSKELASEAQEMIAVFEEGKTLRIELKVE